MEQETVSSLPKRVLWGQKAATRLEASMSTLPPPVPKLTVRPEGKRLNLSKDHMFTEAICWPRNAHKRFIPCRRDTRRSSLLFAQKRQRSITPFRRQTEVARFGPRVQSTAIRGPRECHAAEAASRSRAWSCESRDGVSTNPDPRGASSPDQGPRVSPSSSSKSAPPSCRRAPRKEKEVARGRK